MNSPFKFLDSYTLADRNIFFGRDQEITELYRKVFESKILLVYGASGTGKSSLVNCGLASRFDESDWLPVNIRRGNNIIDSLNKAITSQALTSLKKEQSIINKLQSVYLDHFKPVYLIFDQFEELFIFGDKEERKSFIQIVKSIIESDLHCRFLFVMREEYMAGVTEFERYIPTFFANRVRIEKMSQVNALEAIKGPCKVSSISLEEGFAESLLEKISPEGADVELTYLQVFLDRILRLATGHFPPFGGGQGGGDYPSQEVFKGIAFTIDLLQKTGNVSDLLGSFLDEQISLLSDPDVALAVLKSFVSIKGTKRQMASEDVKEYSITLGKSVEDKALVEMLQNFVHLRILRDKDQNERFELRHDALAAKIYEKFTAIEKDIIEVRQFIENAWHDWQKRGEFLSASDLDYIAPYESRLYLSKEVSGLIENSKRELVRVKQRRRNIAVTATIALLIIFAGFTIWALRERRNALFQQTQAIDSKNKAVESEKQAVESRNKAIESELQATKAKELADKSEKQAVFERNKAIESEQIATQAKEIADRERKIALDQKTKALAEKYNYLAKETVETDPTISLRLAEYAFKLDSSNKNIKNNLERIYYDNNFYTLLSGNESAFTSVVVSPDGQRILTTINQIAHLRDMKGKVIQTFKGHTSNISSVAFSPNGQKILTASSDQTIRLWDLDGNIIRIFTKFSRFPISLVMFFPDGKKFLTVSPFDSIRVWNIQGNLLQALKGPMSINKVAILPDGEKILKSTSLEAQLIDLKGNVIQTFKDPSSSSITSFTYSPDGKKVLTGSLNSNVILWDLKGNIVQILKGHSGQISSLAFSPDGQTVLSGSADQTAKLWDLEGNLLQIFKGHSSIVSSVAFSPDSRNVLTLSDLKARWWNLPEYYKYMVKPPLRISSFAFSPDGRKVIAGLSDTTATIYDLKGNVIQIFRGHRSFVRSVVFSPDGQNILTGSWDTTACLWDLQGNVKQVFKGHSGPVLSVAFSPDGQRVLTGSRDSTVRLWDLNGTLISVFRIPTSFFSSVAFSPDGQQIIVGLLNLNETRLLDMKGSIVKTFRSPSITISPDGKKILINTRKEVQLLNTDGTVLTVFKGHTDNIQSVAFSPNGQKVITGSDDQTVRLWNLDGKLIQVFKTNSGSARFVAFSPDGQYVVAQSGYQEVNLWGIKIPYNEFQKEELSEKLSISQKIEYGILTFEEIYELDDVEKLSAAAQWYYMRSSNLIDDKKNEYLNNYQKLTEKVVSIEMKPIFRINQKKDIKLTDLISEIDLYIRLSQIDRNQNYYASIDSVFYRINNLKSIDYRHLLISLGTFRQNNYNYLDFRAYISGWIIKYYEEQSNYYDFSKEDIIITNTVNSYGGTAMNNLHSGQFKAALELAQKGYKIKQAFSIASDYCLSLLYNERIEDVEPVVSKQKQNSDTFETFRSQTLIGLLSEEGRGHKAKYADKFRDILNK